MKISNNPPKKYSIIDSITLRSPIGLPATVKVEPNSLPKKLLLVFSQHLKKAYTVRYLYKLS